MHASASLPVDRRVVASVLVLALVVPARPGVPAAAGAGGPTEALRTRVDQALRVLGDAELRGREEERRRRLRQLADEIFDWSEAARRALGRHWRDRTPAEQQEFVGLFADLIERTYRSRIEQYSGERVAWDGEQVEGDQATVRTRVVTPQGSDAPVEYRLHRTPGGWRVYDVVIEGVSLIANYRSQFNRIIQGSSYQGLVQRLRAREMPAPGASRRGA